MHSQQAGSILPTLMPTTPVLPPEPGNLLLNPKVGNQLKRIDVVMPMKSDHRRLSLPEWLILSGAIIFILMLVVSAVWEADIRWLHFFQSWMYVATIVLGLRRSRWGYFIGISAAGLWDYTNIFATTFFYNGLQQLSAWVQTGHLRRPDLVISIPAWFSNFAVVVGCVWGYSRLRDKSAADLLKLLLTFVLTTGFFALDMWVFQPRYLGLFRQLLHPRLPW